MPKPIAFRVLHVTLFLGAMVCAFSSMRYTPWEAVLFDPNSLTNTPASSLPTAPGPVPAQVPTLQACIIDLPVAPLWDPPKTPAYEDFRKTFPDLPVRQASTASVERVAKLDSILLNFFLCLWGICAIFAIIYWPSKERDLLLHLVLYLTSGLTAAAALCIVTWMLFGGWGPPTPLFFAFVGSLGGLALGALRWLRTNARIVVENDAAS